MDNSRLPIDICERIIDCFSVVLQERSHIYETLRACALTCSAWVPRSRYKLFFIVHLQSRQQCERYLAVIAEHPERASWVRVMDISAMKEYLPLSQLIVPPFYANCHTLSLNVARNQFPGHYFYRVLGPLFRCCTNIMKLVLFVDLMTFSEIICIVLSMPWLQDLRISSNSNGSGQYRVCWRPQGRQPHPSLTALGLGTAIFHNLGKFAPQCLFGTSIKVLWLDMDNLDGISDNMLQWINACDGIEQLTLILCDDVLQAQSQLLLMLAHLQPGAFKMLTISFFAPWHDPGPAHKLCQTYGVRRPDFLDALRRMQPVLERFTHLEQFSLMLQDDDEAYDGAWWSSHLMEKLPGAKYAVQVVVNLQRSEGPYSSKMLWVPIQDHIHPSEQKENPQETGGEAQEFAEPHPNSHTV
ncbi:hypothetical protein OH77DRAFT_1421924 [Trametes cingulata]|nr:hypothetical protein OH77DRAFT_1421924 [Trametes cingulata]